MFRRPTVPALDAPAAAARLESGALLIDVREQSEWDEARIPGALHRPIGTIDTWWQALPKDRDIIFQCRSGSRSAQVVAALVQQTGMDAVFNLEGGLIAWANAGLPIDDGPPQPEPTDG